MTTATFSRGSTSVEFKILRQGGDLAVARDVGKPNLKTRPRSDDASGPRSSDQRSAQDRLVVLGIFEGPGAYSRADALVEDLVKPHSEGTPLELDLTNVPGFNKVYEVGVPNEQAVELDYQPGIRQRVDLQLSVPIVSDTIG